FLDVLLSSEPVFDETTQLYHRLIAGDLDEAEDMAYQAVKQASLLDFYSNTALPMLVLAARQQASGVTAVQRQRLLEGTARFVRELQADDAPPGEVAPTTIEQNGTTLCLGLRTEFDALSADMLAHALNASGQPARALPIDGWGKSVAQAHGGNSGQRMHLRTLSTTPQPQARLTSRRLRRDWPSAEIVLMAWCGPEALPAGDSRAAMGVDKV